MPRRPRDPAACRCGATPKSSSVPRSPMRRIVVWLDGGADAPAGVSIMAAGHGGSELVTADATAGTVTSRRPPAGPETTATRSVFEVLGERLQRRTRRIAATRRERARSTIAVSLGWFGWFGYELGAQLDDVADLAGRDARCRLPVRRPRGRVRPRGPVGAPRLDRRRATARRDRAWAEQLASDHRARARGIRAVGRCAVAADRGCRSHPSVRWRHDPARYAELIAACQAAIVRGDAYQLCLTNRIDVDVHPDPASTYLALRASSPSHHGGFLRFGDVALLSASPEQFLHVDARRRRLDQADEGHATARRRPGDRRRPARASSSRARRSAPRTS